MGLRLVDTAPGVNPAPLIPGAPVQFALKTTDAGVAVELGTLQTSIGYSRVMNSGFLPDLDLNLSELGAVVQYETTELRNPVTGSVPVTQSAPGILFSKGDNSDNDKCVYAVQFPIEQDASCLAYFKFKVHPAWTLFSPDWLHLSSMTGMYFGLEHGSFNTACYFFLRNAVSGGSAVVGGPLQAYNTTRPGQTEISSFQWSTLPDSTDVEVWIVFNTVGYGSPFSPAYVPVVEIWTKRAGVDTAPVVQEIIPVSSFGQFQPLSDLSFTNVRAAPTNLATVYFGNAGRTGDLLQLDDWAFFPDYRVCVVKGDALSGAEMTVLPDAPITYKASDNLLPTQEAPAAWFPIADTGFLLPAVSFFYQPNNNLTPYAITLQKNNAAPSGFFKQEPRLENVAETPGGAEGGMIEGFLYATETLVASDTFGAGLTIEDGTHIYGAFLLQTSTETTIGILKTYADETLSSYYYPPESGGYTFIPLAAPLAIDWTSPHLVRLALDKLRQKVTLYVDEELVLEVPSTGTFPASLVSYGRMGFGFVYNQSTPSLGTLNVMEMTYAPRYKAYEVRDHLPPQSVTAMPWTLELNDLNGSGAFDAFILQGTTTFTHGGSVITGTSTIFTQQVKAGQVIKQATDPDSDYAVVLSVDSDTHITLSGTYAGASGSGVTAVTTDYASIVLTKTQFNTLSTYAYYTRNDAFGEDKGFYVDFGVQVELYTDITGKIYAPNTWAGSGLYINLGNKQLQLVFVSATSGGNYLGVVPGSGNLSDIIEQTPLGVAFSAPVNWTQPIICRVVVRAFESIQVWASTNVAPLSVQEPLITIPWDRAVAGFDLPVFASAPSIQFGHFDSLTSSTTAWTFIRYGIGDGYEVAVSELFPNGLQPYLFGGKVLVQTIFDES